MVSYSKTRQISFPGDKSLMIGVKGPQMMDQVIYSFGQWGLDVRCRDGKIPLSAVKNLTWRLQDIGETA